MSFRGYLISIAIGTVASFAAWFYVLLSVRPDEATFIDFALLYLTLTMGLIGFLSLFGVMIRVFLFRRHDVVSREVKISFRHAVLLGSVSVLSLFLSQRGNFHWWTLLVLILVVSCIEYVFLSVQRARRG